MSWQPPSADVGRVPAERLRIGVLVVDSRNAAPHEIQALLGLGEGRGINGAAHVAEVVRALGPAVLLMDLLMPGLDIPAESGLCDAQQSELEFTGRAATLARPHHSLRPDAAGDARPVRDEAPTTPERGAPLHQRPRMPDPPDRLTERETDVLKLVAKGLSNRAIAERLFVSEKTIKTHVSSVLAKLRLLSRTQAALYALRHGLVTLDEE